jgi:hypothetical protein
VPSHGVYVQLLLMAFSLFAALLLLLLLLLQISKCSVHGVQLEGGEQLLLPY